MQNKIICCLLIFLFYNLLYTEETTTTSWYNKLVNRFLVKPSTNQTSSANPTNTRYDYFKTFEGMIIRDIIVKNIDVFTVREDTTFNIENTFNKLANKAHFDTDDYYIQMRLLFKVGDAVNPLYFAETERILRDDKHIYNANIVIEPISADTTNAKFVDIYVYERDIWSINVSANYNPKSKKGNILLSDINLFGSGAELFLNVKKNQDFKHGYNLDVGYRYGMFYNYLTSADFYYYGNVHNTRWGFGANQNLENPFYKHLYGLNTEWVKRYTTVVENSSPSTPFEVYYNQQDIWYAHAHAFSQPDAFERQGLFNHLILGGSIINTEFYNSSGLYEDYFKDNTLFLGNVTFLTRQFYQDSHLFAFGKTENIPIGMKADLTAGSTILQDNYRKYLGGSLTFSNHINSFGYHMLEMKAGAFRQDGSFSDGGFEVSSQGITKQVNLKDFKWRHFHLLKYTQTINPFTAENLLSLNNQQGLRGFNPPGYYGEKRLVLNLENNLFLPYKLMGFNTTLVNFIDLGYLASRDEKLFNNKLQSGFGLALRMKNELLVFSTIQLVAAYYPSGSTHGISDYRFFRDTGSFYQYNQMYYAKPNVYNF